MALSTTASAPPVVSPPPGHPRFPLYDSLRGIAVTLIVIIHCVVAAGTSVGDLSPAIRHLQVGVPIFFLVSGFLLYRPFVAARGGAAKVTVRDYARRRVLRVVPGYYAALVLLSICPGLHGVFGDNWWVHFGLLQIYTPLFTPDAGCGAPPYPCGIEASWSLAVEVSFYALLPVLVLAMGRLTRGLRHPVRFELAALTVLGLASAAVRFYAYEGVGAIWLVATLPGTFLWFATGMALAVVSVAVTGRERVPRLVDVVVRRAWIPWTAAIVLAAIEILVFELTMVAGEPTPMGLYVRYFFFTAIALLLLLPATLGDGAGGWPRKILANRVLSWIGVISYGIFLYHLPIAFELASWSAFDISDKGLRFAAIMAATSAISIVCAALSYRFIERPFLRLKYRRRAGDRRPSNVIPVPAEDRAPAS